METLSDSTIQKLSIVSKTRRGQIEILIDILTWASPRSGSKGVTKTHLAYASGLNFRRFEQYLDLLVQRKLIEIVGRSERELVASPLVYSRTAKGERVRMILLEAERLILGGDNNDLDKNEMISFYTSF